MSECLTIQMPFVESFSDYHEIDEEQRNLKKLSGKKTNICCKEIGFDGDYWGVFWIRGNKPSVDEIREMLIKEGFTFTAKHAHWSF